MTVKLNRRLRRLEDVENDLSADSDELEEEVK
jgi:hypothetical protein